LSGFNPVNTNKKRSKEIKQEFTPCFANGIADNISTCEANMMDDARSVVLKTFKRIKLTVNKGIALCFMI
jgi:5,10-methylene-tetrahydrofolate dehydrogenase/methenyl tetrahydrofolate cyclohydrolase